MFNAYFTRFMIALTIFSLSACGFALRGSESLAFKNLYIQGVNLTIARELKKTLKVNGVTLVTDPKQADVFLELISEQNIQNILSLSSDGKVNEYELFYDTYFRIREAGNELWGDVQHIQFRRDFSYDDTQLLAKQYEETRLFDDMKAETVRSIMRRLVIYKPTKK
jgi:LPS-assembly lipoprotein